MLKSKLFAAGMFFIALSASAENEIQWKSYSNDPVIIHKVDSVRNLMTIDEKIGQLNQYSSGFMLDGQKNDSSQFINLSKGFVGSNFNVFGIDKLKKIQEFNMKHSRLRIPLLYAADVGNGFETEFPMPLAEACSWDLNLMEKSCRIAADEATSAGIAWTFAPMIDISRDPRWGRVMEGAGEDVYYGALVAAARVKGFQGGNSPSDLRKNNTMMACPKHFAAYGAAQGGRDYNTVDISEYTLRTNYLPPFKAAIDAGAATIMTAFDDLNGKPSTGNPFLLKKVLREEWGFAGLVVSDYTAINEMVNHGYASDDKNAANLAMNAGVDVDMIGESYVRFLKQLLIEGKVTENQINTAVSRILEMKFLLGLFDNPYKYLDVKRNKQVILSNDNVAAALKSAQNSIVLLKNENKILPLLTDKPMKIAVIGAFADDKKFANTDWADKFTGKRKSSLLDYLKTNYKNNPIEFITSKGCSANIIDSTSGFAEAIRTAAKADLIIAAMGEGEGLCGEGNSRTDICLPGVQRDLLKELKKTGKPIVLVLMNGRPLDLSWEDKNLDALLEAWYPGMMGGQAIADILYGKVNPSAKIVMSFPRNVGQIPIFYNVKNTGRPIDPKDPFGYYRSSYRDVSNSPLYSFGYGLNYSDFHLSPLKLSQTQFTKGGKITVETELSNFGERSGEEVVQLYMRDRVASITRPIKELKGYQKIFLEKGEKKIVKFDIDESTIQFLDENYHPICEPGEFDVWIGNSSSDDAQTARFSFY